MSSQETPVTDSNVVETTEKTIVENDNVENDNVENDNVVNKEMDRKTPRYEVVFFVRYHSSARPSCEEITNYFNKYGTVDHVNSPENRNYAFVFMASLNTAVEHRRTRTSISQIINEMTPENRFHITVASSNRVGYSRPMQYAPPPAPGYHEYSNREYSNREYSGRQYSNRDRAQRYPRYDSQYDNRYRYDANEGELRRPYVRNPQRNAGGSANQYRGQNDRQNDKQNDRQHDGQRNGQRQYHIRRQETQ